MHQERVQVRRSSAAVALAAMLVAGAIVGVVAATPLRRAETTSTSAPASPAPVTGGALTTSFAPVLKAALPAVVNVSSSKVVRQTPQGPGFFFNDPFFRQFFGGPQGPQPQAPLEQRERSLGSGVIVRSDGYILTNNHVVDDASDVRVFLSDRREFKAKVVGKDPKTDIAVLKIDAKDLPTLSMADSSKLEVGDIVLAIGDPFGIGETATMGIVSAKGRGNLDIEDYEDFIQTDAAINPGNSGGALIDARGQLVGINTAILAGGGGGNQGIGFAIPINMARNVFSQILSHGKVLRGYLGVEIQDVTPAIAKSFGLPTPKGALVASVTSKGPAAKAGLEKGDVVLELDGQPVSDVASFRVQIAQTAPGTKVRLKVFRGGKEITVPVEIGQQPAVMAGPGGSAAASSGVLAGIEVQAMSPSIAQELGVPPDTHGVVVTRIRPDAPAADAGLQRGDIIQEIDHHPVRSADDFEHDASATGDTALLLINRQGSTLFVAVER